MWWWRGPRPICATPRSCAPRSPTPTGAAIEIIDFAPRYQQFGRVFRPTAFIRLIRPMTGVARITIRLRPTADWGAPAEHTHGSNHIRFCART
jgi:hypothetical protein